jgi:hypothetical protein
MVDKLYTLLNSRGVAIGSALAVNARAACVAFNRRNHGMPIDLATEAYTRATEEEADAICPCCLAVNRSVETGVNHTCTQCGSVFTASEPI